MSRYPFEEFYNEFMASVRGIYSDTHYKSLARRYCRIGRDLRTLHAEGRISTTSPKAMNSEDVKAWGFKPSRKTALEKVSQMMEMAPRERFELPRSGTSGFRDHRHTGLGYLGSVDV